MSADKASVNLTRTHSFTEAWERSKKFCPACGKAGLWTLPPTEYSLEPGDRAVCTGCGEAFRIAEDTDPYDRSVLEQRLVALRVADEAGAA